MLRVSHDGAVATDILLLPDDILQKILVFVVLQDGCSAILRLALTCQRFNNIVSQEHFQQEAHFSWLDIAYNAARFTKTVGNGQRGNGQRGVLWGFYSSDDNPGYCSWDCFLDDGGLEQ
ncbi:hypothetical protein F2P79_023974 [Pimephales promelas]|nr:hypothetical protein F2P79_023974 [Pimephales promelas]